MKQESEAPTFPVTEKLPEPGTWVFVFTASYRCMGYMDEGGTWRDVFRKEIIEGVQAWSATEERTAALCK